MCKVVSENNNNQILEQLVKSKYSKITKNTIN
jgi:hypothetical protein